MPHWTQEGRHAPPSAIHAPPSAIASGRIRGTAAAAAKPSWLHPAKSGAGSSALPRRAALQKRYTRTHASAAGRKDGATCRREDGAGRKDGAKCRTGGQEGDTHILQILLVFGKLPLQLGCILQRAAQAPQRCHAQRCKRGTLGHERAPPDGRTVPVAALEARGRHAPPSAIARIR